MIRRWGGIAALSCLAVLVLFVVFEAYVGLGLGGWQPNPQSVYAMRARRVDSSLHVGMTRKQVHRVYAVDIGENPNDWSEVNKPDDPSDRRFASEVSDEMDLIIFEPARYIWNSFGTHWIVRAGFDRAGRLMKHEVDNQSCCGPPGL